MEFTQENIIEKGLTLSKNGTYINKRGGPSYYPMDNCVVCGSPYLGQKRYGKIDETCGQKCANKRKEGVKRPEISRMQKGRKIPRHVVEAARQSHLGKPRSEEVKEKIRQKLNSYNSKGIAAYDTYASQIDFAETVRRNGIDSNILEAKCGYCGKWFIPNVNAVRLRRDCLNASTKTGNRECRLYCSTGCKKSCSIFYQMKYPKGFKKATSREVQPDLRKMVLARDNWECQMCGSGKELHCHHITGVEQNPIESADAANCITFCKTCHKKVHSEKGCRYFELRCAA